MQKKALQFAEARIQYSANPIEIQIPDDLLGMSQCPANIPALGGLQSILEEPFDFKLAIIY